MDLTLVPTRTEFSLQEYAALQELAAQRNTDVESIIREATSEFALIRRMKHSGSMALPKAA